MATKVMVTMGKARTRAQRTQQAYALDVTPAFFKISALTQSSAMPITIWATSGTDTAGPRTLKSTANRNGQTIEEDAEANSWLVTPNTPCVARFLAMAM